MDEDIIEYDVARRDLERLFLVKCQTRVRVFACRDALEEFMAIGTRTTISRLKEWMNDHKEFTIIEHNEDGKPHLAFQMDLMRVVVNNDITPIPAHWE